MLGVSRSRKFMRQRVLQCAVVTEVRSCASGELLLVDCEGLDLSWVKEIDFGVS